mmetsp:Transcript_130209/g.324658  ORF Transcript_130209/g.324658 Transcript_130209/m.324658 type:complete len:224 (+) Transcript_130209:1019-1690(+)
MRFPASSNWALTSGWTHTPTSSFHSLTILFEEAPICIANGMTPMLASGLVVGACVGRPGRNFCGHERRRPWWKKSPSEEPVDWCAGAGAVQGVAIVEADAVGAAMLAACAVDVACNLANMPENLLASILSLIVLAMSWSEGGSFLARPQMGCMSGTVSPKSGANCTAMLPNSPPILPDPFTMHASCLGWSCDPDTKPVTKACTNSEEQSETCCTCSGGGVGIA